MLLRVLFLLVLLAFTASGQTLPPHPIQDNSFLIEEAYNQEDGMVQHISMFNRMWPSGDWTYTFTEEFPLGGQTNQFSYTLPVVNTGDPPGLEPGLGDLALNYRLQAIGSGETRVAFAPRLTLIAPTGSVRMQRGMGGWGFQTNLPLSIVLSKHFVTHWNAGMTVIPGAQDAQGDKAESLGVNAGQSIIWLARPRFNVLLETFWTRSSQVVGPGKTVPEDELLLNPGVRWAYNFKNGLQIVPGVSMPIGVGPSAGEIGVLVYLSFEHPWKAFKKH